MTIDETIAKEKANAEKLRKIIETGYDGGISIEVIFCDDTAAIKEAYERFENCAKEHEQRAEWLEELKELREYKKRMEMQHLDDIDNPLEPLKLQSALQSEIIKFNYRKEHRPQDINILDYTVMCALKHCLEEKLKAGVVNE